MFLLLLLRRLLTLGFILWLSPEKIEKAVPFFRGRLSPRSDAVVVCVRTNIRFSDVSSVLVWIAFVSSSTGVLSEVSSSVDETCAGTVLFLKSTRSTALKLPTPGSIGLISGSYPCSRARLSSMIFAAMGAATSPPALPPCTITARASFGWSYGAKAMNQALSSFSPSVQACAVPVFAGHGHSGHLGSSAGSGVVDHAPHPFAYELDLVRREVIHFRKIASDFIRSPH